MTPSPGVTSTKIISIQVFLLVYVRNILHSIFGRAFAIKPNLTKPNKPYQYANLHIQT